MKQEQTNQEQWSSVDEYLAEILAPEAAELNWVLESNLAAGLPEIDVSPLQGKFLSLLVRSSNAKRVLEIGTLGGYSSIWIGRGLAAEGRLVTLELEPHHAEVAQANFVKAGLDLKIEVVQGNALDSLAKMIEEGTPSFDFIFVDADKDNYPNYFEPCVQLLREGGTIVFDNVVRGGSVIAESEDPYVQGVRKLNNLISQTETVTATSIQTVGRKGYDGFTIAVKTF